MSRPDATVTVVCTDIAHEGQEWIVARLARFNEPDVDGDVLPRWSDDPTLKGRVLSLVWTGNKSGQPVYDREQSRIQVFDPPLRSTRLGGHDPHVRYSFYCHLCGASLMSRSEKVRPILEKLAEHGVDRIDLAHLRAMV